jgi:L-alanine-DL-glutamate epimerase-like enolase superfamily enzyme
MATKMIVSVESWPIRGSFTISRGSRTTADVVVVELRTEEHAGRGECVPYPRYGESPDTVQGVLDGMKRYIESGVDRETLRDVMPAGAARNAVDAALWDLEAKQDGKRVWELAGLPEPMPLATAYTLSLDSPTRMAVMAARHADRQLLKLKMGGPEDLARVAAVRTNAPQARIIVDANEGWTVAQYRALAPELKELGVEMIEQPLPAGNDEGLAGIDRPVPVCADESCHTARDLPDLAGKYDMVNIKLDKTGGLTEALHLKRAAAADGFAIMVGCMVATSLAMAPAVLLAQDAEVVDLDGPLLLAEDRPHGLADAQGRIHPPTPALWG